MRAPVRFATLTLFLAAAPPPSVQSQQLVDIRDLTPREHRVEGFVLAARQGLRIEAVGAEPRPDRRGDRESWSRRDDEVSTWPAAAWILDARTREVVWDLRAADTEREPSGLRRFSGALRLPAGVYEAHYASYPAAWVSSSGGDLSLRGLARLGRRARFGGPYVEDGSYKQFALTIAGAGRPAGPGELEAAQRVFTASAIASLRPEPDGAARYGFELTRPTAVVVFALGELREDGAFDYGWIMNADTHARVWVMDYVHSEPAGGAQKNRMARETLRLPAGRYVAYFVCDDTHDPEEWTAVPANDPALWGLTLRVADATARAAVKPYDYEPVPAGQTLVSLIGIGDGASRSAGFTLKRALDVRIYAIGEGVNDDMVDYAWIVDATNHRRIWTMRYDDTEHAGGADKNRVFDGVLHLEAGSYLVYYASDGSHSAAEWNAAPPAEARYWGVSVFPASGRLDPAAAGPFQRGPGGTVVAELVRMENDARAQAAFKLDRDADVRVYAMGEGTDGDMVDYGWIEEEGTGRVVWEMTYRTSDPAGGARKNRVFNGVVRLPAGSYVLRYRSDGSHAYGDWNAAPPDDPESWGITVFRMGDR